MKYLYFTIPQNFIFLLDGECFKLFSAIASYSNRLNATSSDGWISISQKMLVLALKHKKSSGKFLTQKRLEEIFFEARKTLIEFNLIDYKQGEIGKAAKYKLNIDYINAYANLDSNIINVEDLIICIGDEQDNRFDGYINVKKTFKIREKTYQFQSKNKQKVEENELELMKNELEYEDYDEDNLPF